MPLPVLQAGHTRFTADMMPAPSVYFYDFRNGRHHLYLGDFTIADGLSLVSAELPVRIRHIYASSVPTVPQQLAGTQSVATVREFLKQIPSIVDFACSIGAGTTFASHDDCECHFQFDDELLCRATLRLAANTQTADALWEVLQAHPGWYVTISADGGMTMFATLDEYLSAQGRG